MRLQTVRSPDALHRGDADPRGLGHHGGGPVRRLVEKSQIQALDRTQPGSPLKRGRTGTMTHDDKLY